MVQRHIWPKSKTYSQRCRYLWNIFHNPHSIWLCFDFSLKLNCRQLSKPKFLICKIRNSSSQGRNWMEKLYSHQIRPNVITIVIKESEWTWTPTSSCNFISNVIFKIFIVIFPTYRPNPFYPTEFFKCWLGCFVLNNKVNWHTWESDRLWQFDESNIVDTCFMVPKGMHFKMICYELLLMNFFRLFWDVVRPKFNCYLIGSKLLKITNV